MIETLITEHTKALNANTEALNANTEAIHAMLQAGNDAPDTATFKKLVIASGETEEVPEQVITENTKPTRTPAKSKPKVDDTPSVPARQEPGQPPAGEHVDPDEVIAEINKIVKGKMLAGDPEAVKAKWGAIREGYGIERIAQLRDEPAKLLKALAQAKAL